MATNTKKLREIDHYTVNKWYTVRIKYDVKYAGEDVQADCNHIQMLKQLAECVDACENCRHYADMHMTNLNCIDIIKSLYVYKNGEDYHRYLVRIDSRFDYNGEFYDYFVDHEPGENLQYWLRSLSRSLRISLSPKSNLINNLFSTVHTAGYEASKKELIKEMEKEHGF